MVSSHFDAGYLDQITHKLSEIEPFSGYVPEGFNVSSSGVITRQDFFSRYTNDEIKPNREVKTLHPSLVSGEIFFELGSIISSIESAKDEFVMLELGGGWGARSVEALTLVKKSNLRHKMTIVEAMPQHIDLIYQHLSDNKFSPSDVNVINAAVSATNRPQYFPVAPGIFGASVYNSVEEFVTQMPPDRAQKALINLIKTGHMDFMQEFQTSFGVAMRDWAVVSSLTLNQLLYSYDCVDLCDIDIQSAEIEVVPDALNALNSRVKRLHLVTHSESIHEKLLQFFSAESGWEIVASFPPHAAIDLRGIKFFSNDGLICAKNKKF